MNRKIETFERIKKELISTPLSSIQVRRHSGAGIPRILPTVDIRTDSSGRGTAEIFSVYPGIDFSFYRFIGQRISFHHKNVASVLEVHYCHEGRAGWKMHGDISIYLGSGDLSVQGMDCCFDSQMTLPLGYYEGIAVFIDTECLKKNCPEILRDAGFQAENIFQTYCMSHRPAVFPACDEIQGIFSVLYHIPESMQMAYCRLKTQELLLYLTRTDPEQLKEMPPSVSRQTELIREIHDYLIRHPEKRCTIEELSRRYLINTSSLKSEFKAVYGLPIAGYMKEYRIKKAMELLRSTDDSIHDIAARLGYESQGKFTKAFKDIVQTTPVCYRKQNRPVRGM